MDLPYYFMQRNFANQFMRGEEERWGEEGRWGGGEGMSEVDPHGARMYHEEGKWRLRRGACQRLALKHLFVDAKGGCVSVEHGVTEDSMSW